MRMFVVDEQIKRWILGARRNKSRSVPLCPWMSTRRVEVDICIRENTFFFLRGFTYGLTRDYIGCFLAGYACSEGAKTSTHAHTHTHITYYKIAYNLDVYLIYVVIVISRNRRSLRTENLIGTHTHLHRRRTWSILGRTTG